MDTSNINENRPAAPGYEFLQVLGTGGTSTVWLARQVSLDRIVAIKVLDARLLENEEERERFRAEAQATAQLDLPALTRVLDFGEAEGMLYYVMEYIEGTSLAAWLKAHGRMSVVQALQVTDIIASAMGAAWDKAGLVHGDIKPGNILLGQDGSVKLTDLGLARLTARSLGRGGGAAPVADAATADATDGTWTLQGTPTYLAPEQVVGAAASVQSDIYSLGLTLYHLITGKVPFEGLGVDELLEAQQNDFLPDPCDVAGGKVPVGVALLLAKMTAKEPALRPDSWAALLADLEKVESGGKPSGPFPEETESTILLSPAHRPGVRGNTINLSAAGRKAILVTSTPRNSPAGGGDARSGSFAPPPSVQMGDGGNGFLKFLGFLAFLAALAGAVWLFVFRGHPDRWDTLKNSVASIGKSPGSQSGRGNQPGRPLQDVQKEAGDTASADATSSAAPAQPTQAAKAADANEIIAMPGAGGSASRGTDVEGAWADEGYVAAAKQFNEVLTQYQAAVKAEAAPDAAVWSAVERDALAAARALDALRPRAPKDVPLRDYANMAYQLVKDARAHQRTSQQKRADWSHAPKRRHPGAAPWPSPPKDKNNLFATGRMQLGYAWDVLPAPQSTLAVEWLTLISSESTPQPNTAGDDTLTLFGPLRFLMDATEAAQRLRQPLPVRRVVENPLFPYGGVFAYDLAASGLGNIRRPAPPYQKLTLLADADDQLVGIYYLDDEPAGLVHDELAFSPISQVADFGAGIELPGGGSARACHQFLLGNGVVRFDDESADFSSTPPRPLRQSTLIIPKPFLDCLYYHVLGGL